MGCRINLHLVLNGSHAGLHDPLSFNLDQTALTCADAAKETVDLVGTGNTVTRIANFCAKQHKGECLSLSANDRLILPIDNGAYDSLLLRCGESGASASTPSGRSLPVIILAMALA